MDIATKYIQKIVDTYVLSDKTVDKMRENADAINRAFERYLWDDVEHAMAKYYTFKNNKTYPRIGQILSILQADKDVQMLPDTSATPEYSLPKTRLYSIARAFNGVVQMLVDGGIIPGADGKISPKYALSVDGVTPMLCPQMALRWLVNDAERNFPQLYAPYARANWIEKLAIGMQSGAIRVYKTPQKKVNSEPLTTND